MLRYTYIAYIVLNIRGKFLLISRRFEY